MNRCSKVILMQQQKANINRSPEYHNLKHEKTVYKFMREDDKMVLTFANDNDEERTKVLRLIGEAGNASRC